MKNIRRAKNVLFVCICLGLVACTGKEKSSDTMSRTTQKGTAEALTTVYADYLDVKNALFKSDAAKVQSEAKEVVQSIQKESGAIPTEQKSTWDQYTGSISKAAEKITQTNILADQRQAFADLSMALEAGVKKFGLTGKTVYKEYCPMALNGKGANWLSEKEDIENPYFGDEMPNCGSVEETMKY